MALSKPSSRCFNGMRNALEAIHCGRPSQAANILHPLKHDAKLMEKELRQYHQKVRRMEKIYEDKVERRTREINQLYQQEQMLRKNKHELIGLKEQLLSENERNIESLKDAQRRHRQSKYEEERAREKYEDFKTFWWVPIYGQVLLVEELIEDNAGKARQAKRDMERHQRSINEANDDIRDTNSRISDIQSKINTVQRKAEELQHHIQFCHNELKAVKSITVFLLDASTITREIITLTENASVKTESLEKIMRLAAKKNTLRILQSGGTKTKVGSFEECWDEIAYMMRSNSFIQLDKEHLLE